MKAFRRLYLVGGLVVVGMFLLAGPFHLERIKAGSVGSLFSLEAIARLKDGLTGSRPLPTFHDDKPTSAYRWQDEEGVWHFGDEPPADINAEAIAIEQVQTMEFDRLPVAEKPDSKTMDTSETSVPGNPSDYIDRSLRLLDDARQIETMLQEQDAARQEAQGL